ncbi:MAG TPA: inorganic diphosphatase [Pirellulales bacterium]|nr:inorganic diphosphatase [Pirellulales bacterium]
MNYLAIAETAQCEVSPFDDESNVVNVVITAPRGSSCERKFDLATRDFLPGKALPEGVVFPFDFGFIPSTETPDGSPLEVMIFSEEPSRVGSIVAARLIGAIQSEETEAGSATRKNRLLAVLETYYSPSRFHSLDEVDRHLIAIIERFFTRKCAVEGRLFQCVARGGPHQALRLVEQSREWRAS